MPDPLPFPGQPARPQDAPPMDASQMDTNDAVVEFITGLLQILEGRRAADWSSLREDIGALLAQRPAPLVPAGSTPAEFAQSLAEAAFESEDQGAYLAIDALRVDPACSDAWCFLGDDAGEEYELAVMLFTVALMTAQEHLGADAIARYTGQFWVVPETQPFMRALEGLANACQALGDLSTAAQHYGLMIELNPNDHQGARYPLVAILLLANQVDAAGQLLTIYADDQSATLTWARALHKYIEQGPGAEANELLAAALNADRGVAGYITGEAEIPETVPLDERELESIATAMLLRDAWREAPKATEWLLLAEKAGPSLVVDEPPPPPPPGSAPPPKAKRDGPRSID